MCTLFNWYPMSLVSEKTKIHNTSETKGALHSAGRYGLIKVIVTSIQVAKHISSL